MVCTTQIGYICNDLAQKMLCLIEVPELDVYQTQTLLDLEAEGGIRLRYNLKFAENRRQFVTPVRPFTELHTTSGQSHAKSLNRRISLSIACSRRV